MMVLNAGHPHRPPHSTPNGLLNGLHLYAKMLSEATALGPGPLANVGGVTFDPSGPVAGEGAAVFNGANWLHLAHDPSINPSGLFLVSFWAELISSTGTTLLAKGQNSDNFAFYIANVPRSPYLETSDGAQYVDTPADVTAAPPLASGWHHLMGWFDGSQNHFQEDGGTDFSASALAPDAANTDDIFFGGYGTGADRLTGKIASFGLWMGIIPDAAGRALLTAGTPFNDFTN